MLQLFWANGNVGHDWTWNMEYKKANFLSKLIGNQLVIFKIDLAKKEH